MVYFHNMSEQEQKQKNAPILEDRKIQQVDSPVIWLALLAIPLVLALIVGILRKDQTLSKPEKPVYIAPQDAGQRSLAPISADNPIIAQAINAAQPSKPAPAPEAVSCDFEQWVGKEVSDDMLQAIKDAKRPFRILPPGSMMTMDHAPARINFDLNDAGKITRVWCG